MSYFAFPNDPHVAARFFCFMGYHPDRVVNFLTDRMGVHEIEANKIVGRAQEHVRAADNFIDSEVAKNEAAIAAEHDVEKTNDPREDHGQ